MTEQIQTFFIRPLSPMQLAIAALALTLATIAYCMAYTALSGYSESPLEGLQWAALNVLPWLACLEIAKRISGWPMRVAVIGAVLCVVAVLDAFSASTTTAFADEIPFQITRRIPGAALVIAALFLGEALHDVARRRSVNSMYAGTGDLPLLPKQIHWISAAGNYVELHGEGGAVLHRASLSATEVALARHGFVRIHRSVLVPRDRIADVAGDRLRLESGRQFSIGSRYRAHLLEQLG